MIERSIEGEVGNGRHVESPTSKSTRLLLAEDGMGFSLNVTEIEPGLKVRMQYHHHLEAVYCVSGTGSVEDEASGTVHPISPGTLYALDRHDDHALRTTTKLELICIFNPALVGTETRQPDGGYPPP